MDYAIPHPFLGNPFSAILRGIQRTTPMALSAPKTQLISAEEKRDAKAALQEKLHWPVEPKKACLCIPTSLTDTTGGAMFEELIEGLLTLPVQILILGKGSEHFGRLCTKLSKERPHQVAIIPSDNTSVAEMLKAADIALFCSEQSKETMDAVIQYGLVPVAPAGADMQNYNPNQESGIGFAYEGDTAWHCFAAAVRALETYRFPFDWKTIQRNGLESLS